MQDKAVSWCTDVDQETVSFNLIVEKFAIIWLLKTPAPIQTSVSMVGLAIGDLPVRGQRCLGDVAGRS